MGGKRWVVTALIGVAAAVGMSACGDGDDALRGAVQATELLRFDPDRINVTLNQEVTFSFENTDDSREHNFTIYSVFIDDIGTPVSVDVPSGQTKQVKFTVRNRPRDGFITFLCRFHQADGMTGRIMVL